MLPSVILLNVLKRSLEMATRKGIIITIIILVAIAGGSSIMWIIPQHRGSTVAVTDFGKEIQSVNDRHALIMTAMNSNLKSMLNNTLSPDDFVASAQASSSQVTSLTSELIEADPPAQWRSSYLNYDEALKKYNDYLTETIALANKVKDGASQSDISDETSKLSSLMNETDSFIARSNEAKP